MIPLCWCLFDWLFGLSVFLCSLRLIEDGFLDDKGWLAVNASGDDLSCGLSGLVSILVL